MSSVDLNAVNEEICLQLKARKEILLNKYKKMYNLKFELGYLGKDPFGKPYTDLRDEIIDLTKALKEQAASNYMWITISISPAWIYEYFQESDPEFHKLTETLSATAAAAQWMGEFDSFQEIEMNNELMRKAIKFANSKMFSDYMFVIEQRKSEYKEHEVFRGQHFHFLVKRNPLYPPSQVDRNTRRVWQNHCDTKKRTDGSRTPCHILQCPAEYVNDKIGYIIGQKTGNKIDGTQKIEVQKVDKIFRKNFKFNDLYFKVQNDQLMHKAIELLEKK